MKVLVSDKISDEGLKKLRDAGLEVDMKTGLPEAELVKIITGYDALVVRSETKVTLPIIEAGKNLKIIARAGVGVDNIDLPTATKRGVIVVNSPEGNTVAAAEHTLALLLTLARNIPEARESLRAGKWERSRFTGVEVFNKTLGVIGLGKIGRRVASYASALGMKVEAYDPFISSEVAEKRGIELASLEEVLSTADFITLHIPKTKETTHLIDKKRISLMKDGVRIVNCARGGIVDEAALLDALKSGKVAGAALDVFEVEPPSTDNPLLKLPNVVAVPHLGAATIEAQVNVAVDVVEQIIDVLRGEPARSAVNIPSLRPDILAPVKPYLPLAEKLGKLASALVNFAPVGVEATYSGEIAEHEVAPLTVAILKGLLEPALQESVNFVNAPLIARERGIKVMESKDTAVKDFANLISLKVKGNKVKSSVEGTILGVYGERIVSINGLKIEAIPTGYLLLIPNIDKPGIIGRVGTFLGSHKINIAGMDVGRESIGGKAIMVLNVDDPVSDDLLHQLSKLEGVNGEAKIVKL